MEHLQRSVACLDSEVAPGQATGKCHSEEISSVREPARPPRSLASLACPYITQFSKERPHVSQTDMHIKPENNGRSILSHPGLENNYLSTIVIGNARQTVSLMLGCSTISTSMTCAVCNLRFSPSVTNRFLIGRCNSISVSGSRFR